mgnify:CR=1 FL=1
MIEKLIFIPYQDSDDFLMSGILTREYAMLYMINKELNIKDIINIKKPRTELDGKRYLVKDELFPKGTIEESAKEIIFNSVTIQYKPIISLNQILNRRAWWQDGYDKTIQLIKQLKLDYSKCIVYSNNPFAYKLIKFLYNNGAKVYFDAMDNFAIHPSLNNKEHKIAFEGYKVCSKNNNCFSVNSVQTQNYMKGNFKINVELVKNGIFPNNSSNIGICNLRQYSILKSKSLEYKKVIGYIGKIGKRIDEQLVDNISNNSKDCLFVFIGPYLKGQTNEHLLKLFDERKNILHLESISSAYVLDFLNEFDILMIPHAIGKAENGGDPLKLYQYLSTEKPIITTEILGVNEFKHVLYISNKSEEWIDFINNPLLLNEKREIQEFEWITRFSPILEIIKKW